MSDEDAFLAAITASPADDTPRLVYADWLDDRGDPRAEYVRREVERHRLKARDPKRPDLTARLEALRPLADPHWLPRIDRVTRFTDSFGALYDIRPRRSAVAGQPFVVVGAPQMSARPGDYVYAISLIDNKLHVLARARMTRIVPSINPTSAAVESAEQTPIRFDRPLTQAALARFGWYSGRKERPAELTPDGLGLSINTITTLNLGGALRLLPSAAAEFDRLLRDG